MASRRRVVLIWLALIAAMASGCCWRQRGGGRVMCRDGLAGDVGCATCGEPVSSGLFRGPLQAWRSCIAGCGELYVDEWLSDPPKCCDPCDDCGQYVGPVARCRGADGPIANGRYGGLRFHEDGAGCAEIPRSVEPGPVWYEGGGPASEEVIIDESWSQSEPAAKTQTASFRAPRRVKK